MAEAEQLYVRQSRLAERLRALEAPILVLFDVGMGAASNAIAALAESEAAPSSAARLELISFERDSGALRMALSQPGDKAATTAAAVRATDLEHPLDRNWLTRLSLPKAPLPSDAPADAVKRVAAAPQFSVAG
jgi:hypothetical protein